MYLHTLNCCNKKKVNFSKSLKNFVKKSQISSNNIKLRQVSSNIVKKCQIFLAQNHLKLLIKKNSRRKE